MWVCYLIGAIMRVVTFSTIIIETHIIIFPKNFLHFKYHLCVEFITASIFFVSATVTTINAPVVAWVTQFSSHFISFAIDKIYFAFSSKWVLQINLEKIADCIADIANFFFARLLLRRKFNVFEKFWTNINVDVPIKILMWIRLAINLIRKCAS